MANRMSSSVWPRGQKDQTADTVRTSVLAGLTEREQQVFASLTDDWVRPMDIGGRDSSYHSRVLASLVRKGLVERKGTGSYRYRNPNYVAPPPVPTRFDHAIRFTRILAGYDCAGIDQEHGDATPCGKCGPCEAASFLERFTIAFKTGTREGQK